MKKLDNFPGCQEISKTDLITINGGESAAYWFGYAIGRAAKFIQDAFDPSSN